MCKKNLPSQCKDGRFWEKENSACFVLFVVMKIHVVIVYLVNRAQRKLFQSCLRLDIPIIKNWRFQTVFEYLCKKSVLINLQLDVFFVVVFPPGNEGSAAIFVMKIHVGIVHLVTSAQKCCHEAALGLVVLSKTTAFRNILKCLHAKCVFLHPQLNVFKRLRVVGVG